MSTIKRAVGLLAVGAALYGMLVVWQGPLFALYQIDRGLQAKSAERVQQHADLSLIVASVAQTAGSGVGDALTTDPQSGALGALVSALGGVVAGELGKTLAPAAVTALRAAINDGTVTRGVGPFVVDTGLSALGAVQSFSEHATVVLHGSCRGSPAQLTVVLERRDVGGTLGLLHKHVLVGVQRESAVALMRSCR